MVAVEAFVELVVCAVFSMFDEVFFFFFLVVFALYVLAVTGMMLLGRVIILYE